MLLRDELEAKLAQFNPWMSKDAIRSSHRDARRHSADYANVGRSVGPILKLWHKHQR